jgi:dienelactone hydrolase
MGSSMGGNGAMHMAAEFPEMFAACAPLSCWCQHIPVQKAAVMPIYCSHGTKDKTVPIKWARDIRKRLEGLPGLKLEYHELDYGHQPPTEVMIKAADWMSQFSNPRQFDTAAMKERAVRLPLKQWMKRAAYRRDYANARAWNLLTCENEKLRDYASSLRRVYMVQK